MTRCDLAAVVATVTILAAVSPPAAAAELASMHKQVRDGAKTCMATHAHHIESGGFATRKQAEQYGVRRWEAFTRLEYGDDWAKFKLAAAPSVTCSSLSSAGGQVTSCKIAARPCRLGR